MSRQNDPDLGKWIDSHTERGGSVMGTDHEGKKRPGSDRLKRAAVVLVTLAVLFAGGWALFNVVTDPFGVFGDHLLGWWAYNETRNPQTAKFSYLEQHQGEFDSYIIGGPSTGAWSTQALDEYFGTRFYNLTLNSQDMLDIERFVRWLLTHHEVKNLVLNVTVDDALIYGSQERSLTTAMPWELDGSSALGHYLRYLFASPRYGLSKLKRMYMDGLVPDSFDVFDADTGAIDYSAKDVEAIGTVTLEGYMAAHPEFSSQSGPFTLAGRQGCVDSVAAIRELCQQTGVELTVIAAPSYHDHLTRFSQDEVEEFFTALAQVTPYWDFTSSALSWDPRYFYDPTCFRTHVGKMMLARIFGDDTVYCPDDFGTYTELGGTPSKLWDVEGADLASYTVKVPILMYHHLTESTLSGDTLDEQLGALAQAGYTAVTMADLRAYVEQGADLPDKPVVITFDDGYTSNLEVGLPILEKHRMKATIYVIGCSVGKDTYKDTGEAMTPHFTGEQAKDMEAGGLITIGSHGYDIHEVNGRDPDPIRHGVLQREDESEADYVRFLKEDCARFDRLMGPVLGHKVDILAYPYGQCSPLSEMILAQEGIFATVTTLPGDNILVKGLPQTLRAMSRYDLEAMDLTGEGLLALLEG